VAKRAAAGVDGSTAGRLIASAILTVLTPPFDAQFAEGGKSGFFAVNYGALLPFESLLVVPLELFSSLVVFEVSVELSFDRLGIVRERSAGSL